MTRPSAWVLRQCVLAAVVLAAGCSAGTLPELTDARDSRDARRDDGGGGDAACVPGDCLASCLAAGSSGGTCGDAGCTCVGGDADAGTDVGPLCEADPCRDSCVIRGYAGGDCVGDSCVCGDGADGGGDADADADGAADADADAGADADAADGSADDAGPLDGGTCTVADFPQQHLCRSGFKCTIATLSGGSAVPICDLDGTGGNGAPCADAAPPATTDDCAAAYYCLSTGSGSHCMRFCANNADCSAALGSSSGCFFTMNDGSGGSVPGVRFCTAGCDAHADFGCTSGQTCRLVGDATGLYTDCSTAGAGTQGAGCALGGDEACAAHYSCLGSGSSARCFRFCFGDSDCYVVGSQSQCLIGVLDGTGASIPGFEVCSDACDVFSDTVCMPRGEACRMGTFTGHTGVATYCGSPGAGGQGAGCAAGSSACQAGFDCWNVTGYGSICLQWCHTAGGAPYCSGGSICQAAGSPYASTVGVCVPP